VPKGNGVMKDAILAWYVNGETGISSKAMAAVFSGIEPVNRWFGNHPSDPSDFNRCLKLLNAVPEARNHMDKVAKLSDVWAKLVDRWDEVKKCFLDEVGYDWCKAKEAPKTYALMKEIGC
jgi:hypothetical protein